MIQQEIIRKFNREWGPHLSPPEFRLLSFILDGTINWGRVKRVFSYRFMEHGDALVGGTGVAKRNLINTVKALEAKRFIAVDRSDMTKGLVITPNLNWEEDMLAIPKRLKEAAENTAHTSGSDANWFENHDNFAEIGDKNIAPPVSKSSPH